MRRVDNISWYQQPFFQLFGWVTGWAYVALTRFIHATCRIRFSGASLPTVSGAVYCIWHQHLLLYFGVFPDQHKQVWMSHPAWYMKPVHVMKRLLGVKRLYLGSSGNSGKEALANVVADLKQGYSTTVACDGPNGPPEVLKPGVLYMSRDSGLPVIPLRFECTRYFRIGGWDRKWMPWPFSNITVHVGDPLYVTSENLEEMRINAEAFLQGN